MCPLLTFHLFGITLTIGAYRFFTVAAACAGMIVALPLLHREGLPYRRAIGLSLLLAVSFLLGARLLNWVINPSAYGAAMHLWTLRLAGFSLYGGLLGALIALLIWIRRQRRNLWSTLDAFVLPGGLAFAIARAGCFLTGCCGGKSTSSWLGVEFPSHKTSLDTFIQGIPTLGTLSRAVYPTQLFEMTLALIGLIPVIWLHSRRKAPPGTVFLLYGLWFTAMRWVILPLRSLSYAAVVIHAVYPLLYGCLILAGIWLLARHFTKRTGPDLILNRKDDKMTASK